MGENLKCLGKTGSDVFKPLEGILRAREATQGSPALRIHHRQG